MQVIRTVVWVVLFIALLLFSLNNWTAVTVKIWEDLVWETRLPAVVILPFLLGLVPMWLLHVADRWRLRRRITSLELSARQTSALTSTQLEAAAPDGEPASQTEQKVP